MQGGLGRWKMWGIKWSADQESRGCAPTQQVRLFLTTLASLGSRMIINHLHKQRTKLCTCTCCTDQWRHFFKSNFLPPIRSCWPGLVDASQFEIGRWVNSWHHLPLTSAPPMPFIAHLVGTKRESVSWAAFQTFAKKISAVLLLLLLQLLTAHTHLCERCVSHQHHQHQQHQKQQELEKASGEAEVRKGASFATAFCHCW